MAQSEILPYVEHIIKIGRISGDNNEQYCYVTTFMRQDGRRLVICATKPNEQTDTFTAYFDS